MQDVLDIGHIHPVLTVAAARGAAERGNDRRAAARGDDIRSQLPATIRAVAAGDQDAFSRLYAGYVRMVHAILLGRVPRRDVDDLVQDVFLAAYTRIGELRDAAAFGGWIATIA